MNFVVKLLIAAGIVVIGLPLALYGWQTIQKEAHAKNDELLIPAYVEMVVGDSASEHNKDRLEFCKIRNLKWQRQEPEAPGSDRKYAVTGDLETQDGKNFGSVAGTIFFAGAYTQECVLVVDCEGQFSDIKSQERWGWGGAKNSETTLVGPKTTEGQNFFKLSNGVKEGRNFSQRSHWVTIETP